MTDNLTAPPYSEKEATVWLAWLAFNMRRRDLTIFQIESLQPNWLAGRKETVLHLLLTRTLWGVFVGLTGGLIFGLSAGLSGGLRIGLIFGLSGGLRIGLSAGLIFGLIDGLIGGLIGGLIFGLIEIGTPIYKFDSFLRSRGNPTSRLISGTIIFGLIFGLIDGLMGGLTVGLIYRLTVGLVGGLSVGLISGLSAGLIGGMGSGLIFGFVRTTRVAQREADGLIHTIESVGWSWQHVLPNAAKGLIVGLVVQLMSVLIAWLGDWTIYGLSVRLSDGLVGVLISVLIFGLIGGFQPGAEELKTRPNQGIWLTVWSALKMGLLVGGTVGCLLWLLSQNIALGLAYGTVTSLVIATWYGGLDAIEHGIVRFILAWQAHAPLNYAHFLDYATEELNFLQKVGGGYIFIHRYLLEHFAEIAVEKGYFPILP